MTWRCGLCGHHVTTHKEVKWVVCTHKGTADSQKPSQMEPVERKEAS